MKSSELGMCFGLAVAAAVVVGVVLLYSHNTGEVLLVISIRNNLNFPAKRW